MRDQRVYCPLCNDVIGVYESAVVIDELHARETALAREPSLREGEHIVMHRDCALTHRQAD